MEIGSFAATRAARTADPKRYAQEQAAKGNWRPTDQLLRKMDPDFVQRFFILEAKKISLRKLYSRATLIERKVENGTSRADRIQQASLDFWAEYDALDRIWIGDREELKAKENI